MIDKEISSKDAIKGDIEKVDVGVNAAGIISSHQPQATGHHRDDEISLLDILIVLAKHKKLVLGLPLIAAVVTAGITLLMPNWYTATAKILPPQQGQSNAVAILGQLGALSGGVGSALGVKNPSDIFVA